MPCPDSLPLVPCCHHTPAPHSRQTLLNSCVAEQWLGSYAVLDGCCYLTLCEARYPKKLAIAYLHDLAKEFNQLFGTQVETTNRPFAFQTQFGVFFCCFWQS
eukprot:TRINITY_DN1728_c0_g1_i4.p2 TRINITY_DN1728_c0_g1~~TRINITY_DN1728_c0_g1_i4.p2  ORF type:complete len:102 (-),score=8.98 TRINITY_DN1728_c0_g1_i4:504-809(-)